MNRISCLFLAFLSIGVYGVIIDKTPLGQIGILGIIEPVPSRCSTAEGLGNFLKMEMTACTNQPCALRPEISYEMAVTLRLPRTTLTLTHEIVYFDNISKAKTNLSPRTTVDETFQIGNEYRIQPQILIPPSIAGTAGRVEVYIYDIEGYLIFRCFDALVSN